MLSVFIASKIPKWADNLVPPPENIGTISLTEHFSLDNHCQPKVLYLSYYKFHC
ncbi:hypothetical protein C427_4163 [Paraglaciecola psychrophila 170]|uniref:Uncharacterized protein n=1 Tax=Paraglaciecola psychrophila 170 TaxID=1129794 RepID=K7AVK2_9ALTE|nr:hypothetical protein C427_4163 [Paraglaciecola psychrophila 170]GAC39210.1 hypothetical protein GPSY_3599 [Paraglaciecola psychrophila 170]